MKKQSPLLIIIAVIAAIALIIGLTLGGIWLYVHNSEYDFHTTVPGSQAILRTQLVQTAETWLGANEADGSHKAIIDLYNGHTPLAQNYQVKYDDSWCATFVSAAAIECGFTEIIPTECGCQRQIELFKELDCWEEADDYKPFPGDIIYYCLKNTSPGDCTDWSDHVGIVVGTKGNFIKVIEGNYAEKVAYRYLSVDDAIIRGYGIPDYALLTE